MKIQKLNHWTFLPLICLAATFITSCGGGGGGGGGIFAAVEDEVKLNKVSVTNIIKTMVVHGGNLYCTNGAKLFVKGLTSGTGWTTTDNPYSSRIALLASDASNLYVMTEDYKVRVWDGGDVTGSGYSGKAIAIFDNQYIENNSIAHREAFIATDSGCFKVNGTTATLASGVSSKTRGAIWNNGSTVFVNTPCVKSNFNYTIYWTPDLPITAGSAQTGNPSYDGSSINDIFTTVRSSTTETIRTLAYSKENGTEYMLIGTSTSGYRKIQMSNGTKVDVHLNGNQFDTFPIAEDGIWVIPDGTETRAIYASVVSVSDTSRNGLWAWYPGSGWNLD